MNGSSESEAATTWHPSKLLSGDSLLLTHINAGKLLPKDGPKDFSPSGSWMEKRQIQAALEERKGLLDEERVEKWGSLASAVWDHKKKLAEVTRRIGKHFQTLGFENEGTLYLYPEEALYLLEMNCLELLFGGVPVSIQQGYSLLLGSQCGCNLIEYRTFSHLLRQGYRLLRFTSQEVHTKYERMIRLDQHTSRKRKRRTPPDIHSLSKSGNWVNVCGVKSDSALLKDSSEKQSLGLPAKQEEEEKRSSQYEDPLHKELSTTKSSSCKEDGSLKGEKEFLAEQHNDGVIQMISHQENLNPGDSSFSQELPVHHGDASEKIRDGLANSAITEQLGNVANIRHDDEEQTKGDSTQIQGNDGVDDKSAIVQDDNKTDSVESSTTALSIQNSMSSLGSSLIDEESSIVHGSESKGLCDGIQSEKPRVLGAQDEPDLSNEEPVAGIFSDGCAILSDVSRRQSSDVSNGSVHFNDDNKESNMRSPLVSTVLESEREGAGNTDDGKSQLPYEVSLSPHMVEETSANPNTTSCLPEASPPVSEEKDSSSNDLKGSSLSSDGEENLEPVPVKRAKVNDVHDDEIEVLSPEEKHIELVDLSDESSVDSDDSSEAESNNGIEIIDVDDSSSSSSAESDDCSSESDDSVVLEIEQNSSSSWKKDRMKILNTFPDMHNLTEISVTPPSPDLLPSNVQPQCHQYIISRDSLRLDSKAKCIEVHMTSRPQPPFNIQPYDVDPMEIRQPSVDLAPLILPNRRSPSAAHSSDEIWMPTNAWFPPQFGRGRRRGQGPFKGRSRGSRWQRPYRHRPYGHGPRPYHSHRGKLNRDQHAAFYQRVDYSFPETVEAERNRGVASVSNDEDKETEDEVQGRSLWRSWMQQHAPRKQGKARRQRRGRTPRYHSHLYKYLNTEEESCEIVSVKSDSPSVRDEMLSSDEDSKSNVLSDINQTEISNHSFHEDSQSTNSSSCSSSEVKPLLSPSDCTSFENVFKTVRVIKPADTDDLLSNVYDNLKPQFELFSPNKPFKKSKPPVPDFHLCITSYESTVPAPGEIRALSAALGDQVPILFAVVSPDSISFIEFADVRLPS